MSVKMDSKREMTYTEMVESINKKVSKEMETLLNSIINCSGKWNLFSEVKND